MYLHVRYWDTSMNIVRTRFYNSEFLGKAAATDILERFRKCMSGLDENKMSQVSMDGPHVNTSFLSLEREKERRRAKSPDINWNMWSSHDALHLSMVKTRQDGN